MRGLSLPKPAKYYFLPQTEQQPGLSIIHQLPTLFTRPWAPKGQMALFFLLLPGGTLGSMQESSFDILCLLRGSLCLLGLGADLSFPKWKGMLNPVSLLTLQEKPSELLYGRLS